MITFEPFFDDLCNQFFPFLTIFVFVFRVNFKTLFDSFFEAFYDFFGIFWWCIWNEIFKAIFNHCVILIHNFFAIIFEPFPTIFFYSYCLFLTIYERNNKTIYVIFNHCVILVHKGVWYGKFLVLIEACLISYLRGSFSIFFLKFMQQEMAVLTGKSLLENVTAQRWESKSWDSTKIFPSLLCMLLIPLSSTIKEG